MGAVVTSAMAMPGQCTVTGYGWFDCEVVLDGAGLAFDLPDGRTFAFTLTEEGSGTGFLGDADPEPGQYPKVLQGFSALENKPGCWASEQEDFEFCVLVQQSAASTRDRE